MLFRSAIHARGLRGKPETATSREARLIAAIDARIATAGGRWGNGVYSARELAAMAIAPQSGKLTCTTQCHCKLEDVPRPEGKPRGKEAASAFVSLEPKDFTGKGERVYDVPKREGYEKRARRTQHRHVGRS